MSKKKNIDFDKEFENFDKEFEQDNSVNQDVPTQEETTQEQEEQCNCEECQEESKEAFYLNLAQRVQAEFDNYRKRTKDLELESKNKGVAQAVLELLNVIDSIESAKKLLKEPESLDAISVIEKQFYMCFEKLGVKKIESLGKQFDPTVHNAIMCAQDYTQEDDIILQVFQEGFTLNDKVIRYAMVQVNKR